jgi:hypothetical protein
MGGEGSGNWYRFIQALLRLLSPTGRGPILGAAVLLLTLFTLVRRRVILRSWTSPYRSSGK